MFGCTKWSLSAGIVFGVSFLFFLIGFSTDYAASASAVHIGLFVDGTSPGDYEAWQEAAQTFACFALLCLLAVAALFIIRVVKQDFHVRLICLVRSILLLVAAGLLVLAAIIVGAEVDQLTGFKVDYSYALLVVSALGFLAAGILSIFDWKTHRTTVTSMS